MTGRDARKQADSAANPLYQCSLLQCSEICVCKSQAIMLHNKLQNIRSILSFPMHFWSFSFGKEPNYLLKIRENERSYQIRDFSAIEVISLTVPSVY
jgi:hypothetical protein